MPSTDAGAGAVRSTWGSWAVFWTRLAMDSWGPGRMTPPTSSFWLLTPMMVRAVSEKITAMGAGPSAMAATTPHSSSPPSWDGWSSRSLSPLFKPGPTVIMRTAVSIRRAAMTWPVRAGTTLASMTPSIWSGALWWRVSRWISRMAYSSEVAAAADSLPENSSAPAR